MALFFKTLGFLLFVVVPCCLSIEEVGEAADCDDKRARCYERFQNKYSDFHGREFSHGLTLCNEATRSMDCIRRLDCSEIMLRVLHVRAKETLKSHNIDCDKLDDVYPIVQPGTDECKEKRQMCLLAYVDMQSEADLSKKDKCRNLNTYLDCLYKVDACDVTAEQVRALQDEENRRLHTKCELPMPSASAVLTASVSLVLSCAAALFLRQ